MIDNKLRITAGNTFATAHTITAQDVQWQPIPDFDLQECTDIQVYARNGGSYKPVTSWQLDDQSVVVMWYGKQMKLGGYDFYIAGKFNGADWRTSEATIFEIVQYNEEANIPADTIVVDGTYFLDASFSLITEIQGGGGATPSSTLPLMDDEASVGTENAYARGDHRHPSDTNKQDVITDLATIRSGAAAGATALQPSALTGYATETYVGNAVSGEATRAETAEGLLQDAIDAIEEVIPNAATSSNKLADKDFVNHSIATNTATFKGTYNSLAELQQVTATNNDYAFVIETDSVGNEYYDRYKYVTGTGWVYEYKVESTPFTSEQWAAIQSGITSALVTKIGTALQPTDIIDALNSGSTTAALSANQGKVLDESKQDVIDASHKLPYSYISDTPTIPSALSDLSDDSTHRVVTDTQISTWDNKANKVLVNNHGTDDTTYSVTPNALHIWGTVASLTLTLATPTDATIVNEYMIEFTSGSTATTLSLPSSVEWAESCGALSVEASKTYQISIVNNIGLWASISNS